MRLVLRHQLSEGLALVGRTAVFHRGYRSGGRDDDRLRGTLGLDWQIGEQSRFSGFLGYQGNDSTLAAKDYSGAVFGIELGYRF